MNKSLLLTKTTFSIAKLRLIFAIHALLQFFIFLSALSIAESNELSNLMESGNQAFSIGDYQQAEGFFIKVLTIEPDNYSPIAKTPILSISKFHPTARC